MSALEVSNHSFGIFSFLFYTIYFVSGLKLRFLCGDVLAVSVLNNLC